jgi:hypothetical protein
MPNHLEKPFIRWESYFYDEYTMSENFFVVENVEQVKKPLREMPSEDFKAWLQSVRDESNNKDPIDLMVFYWYFTEGMDKPYKNDITDLLIKDVVSENEQYLENLYNLLKAYNQRTRWHWCRAINELKDSSLAAEWKAKFLALCGGAGGKRSKTRRNSKNRSNANKRNRSTRSRK